MEIGGMDWELLVRFRRRTHASRTATSCARPNLVTEAVERGLCGEGVSEETLEPLPEVLRTGTETLIAALKDATAVARA
jgi:hypothetical protein